MEKKTKKGMKKLLLSVCAMVVALVGTITSTYAWFTMTASPQVGDFQVKVTTVSGLEIALDTRGYLGNDDAGWTVNTTTAYTALDYKSFISGVEIENHLKSFSRAATTVEGNINSVTAAQALMLSPAKTMDGKAFSNITGTKAYSASEKGDLKGIFEGTSDVSKDVGFLEFSLYFRIATADKVPTENRVVLDMFNYSGDDTVDYRDADNDVRTFVNASTLDTAESYELPTQWKGTAGLTAIDTTGAVHTGANTIDYYVIKNYAVVDANGTILAININKYLDNTYGAETGEDKFVDPSTGNQRVVTFDTGAVPKVNNIAALRSDNSTTTFVAVGENASAIDATGGKVVIKGYAANALRLSFSEITYAGLNDRTEATGEATMWDPRNGLGIFNDDGDTSNFALHMLYASGRNTALDGAEREMPSDYLGDQITNRNETPSTGIGDQKITTLSLNGDYYYGATTIRIWVDGWDAECFDGIMARIATIGFQFKTVA